MTPDEPQGTSTVRRVRAQRTPARAMLGACVALSADDLSFVDSDTDWLKIRKTKREKGLLIEIGV